MENTKLLKVEADRKVWFSMWFLGAVVTFGLAFFWMFHRLVEGRNHHFKHEAELENQVNDFLIKQGKQLNRGIEDIKQRNAKVWAASIILIAPVFVLLYLLSKDLLVHEKRMDTFLVSAFPQRLFMTQTIPIKTYAVLTIITLGIGGIYWLYKLVNLYNAHYKAHRNVEKEVFKMMEEQQTVRHM
jgi:hypothetical protein